MRPASTSSSQDRGGLGHEQLIAARDQLLAHGRARIPRSAQVRPERPRATRRSSRSTSTARRRARSASRSPTSTDALDRVGRRATSTTSSTTAASSACTCRATRRSACSPRTSNAGTCATRAASMVPFAAFATAHWTYGSPKLVALQRRARVRDPGRSRRRATARARRWTTMESLVGQLPAGIGYEWTGLSYEETAVGLRRRRCCTRSRCSSCSCASRRSTRAGRSRSRCMLVVPLGVLGARARDVAARARERRVLPGRPAHDDRPRGEERDPDRRVRQGERRARARA